MKNKGFTLVELIVVITILAILSTLGFVMYTDYLRGVRDSSRVQQMTEIHKALTLYGTRSRLPLPEEAVAIVSGASAVGTQGYANQSVLDTVKYSDGGRDPQTKNYYTYFASPDRKYAQILGFFEERSISDLLTLFPKLYAEDHNDYISLYPQVYGAELGVLLEEETQIPIQELNGETLDILTITGSLISYLNNSEIITGSGSALYGMVPNTDCKKLLNSISGSQSGIYKLNPSGVKQIDVYCDMELDGGGWTLIARSIKLYLGEDKSFGWLTQRGTVYDNSLPYSLGSDSKNMSFSEIAFGTYDNDKVFNLPARKMLVDSTVLSQEITTEVESLTGCESTTDLICSVEDWWANKFWGFINDDLEYNVGAFAGGTPWFRGQLTVNKFNSNANPSAHKSEQGMIFVR